MKKVIFFPLAFLIMLLSIIPIIFAWLFFFYKPAKRFFIRVGSLFIARAIILSSFNTVEVKGLNRLKKVEKNALFVSNHQSMFDIVLITAYIPKIIGYVAKKELFKIPILSFWMSLFGCISIKRENIKEAKVVIEKGIKKLKNGENLLVFPEGTRSRSNNMKKFKSGSFRLAKETNATIVPLTCINTSQALNRQIKKITLIIHPVIKTNSLDEKQFLQLHKTVENIIRKGLKRG